MNMTELYDVTLTDWLISMWWVWLLLVGVALGIVAKWLTPKR